MLTDVIEAITAQQPKEENAVWMVGEQLKEKLHAAMTALGKTLEG